jgi:hypothetical protein
LKKDKAMNKATDDLQAADDKMKAANAAGMARIKELAAQLAASSGDVAKVEAIAADISAQADAMTAAAAPPTAAGS